MAVMDGPIYNKAAAVCIIVAFFMFLVAFGSPHWAKSDPSVSRRKDHIGLWKYCSYAKYAVGEGDYCNDFVDIIVGDWLKAAQGFMTLGFFSFLACLGLVLPYVAVTDNNLITTGAIVSTSVTGLFLLVGVAVFGGKYNEWFKEQEPHLGLHGLLSWAYGVGVASMILVFVTLGLVILNMIESRKEVD